jgi:hypothetical protein
MTGYRFPGQAERRLWMHSQMTKQQLLSLLKPCTATRYTVTEYSRKPLKTPKGKLKMADCRSELSLIPYLPHILSKMLFLHFVELTTVGKFQFKGLLPVAVRN